MEEQAYWQPNGFGAQRKVRCFMRGEKGLLMLALAAVLALLPSRLRGEFLYVGGGSVGTGAYTVYGYSIDSRTGALTPVPGSPLILGGWVSAVAADPKGRFLYATYSGQISVFRIDPLTGSLAQVPASACARTFATDVAIHPTGRFAYVADGATLSVCSIDLSTGSLTFLQQIPNVRWGYAPTIGIDPTGKFVYVSDGGATFLGYAVDQNTGTLTSGSWVAF